MLQAHRTQDITSSGANEYHFLTHWRVRGTLTEVTDILGDVMQLTRWWPAVYLDVKELTLGDANGVGREINLYTKGFLPYTLLWGFRVTEVEPQKRIKLEAKGDFVGYGIWTFESAGEWVNIQYEWRIHAEKPILRDLSFLLKPIFSANHRWAMQKGLESLELELLRRRAPTPADRARIPPPPAATTTSIIPWLLAAAALLAVLGILIRGITIGF
jgi:hypothetical protein